MISESSMHWVVMLHVSLGYLGEQVRIPAYEFHVLNLRPSTNVVGTENSLGGAYCEPPVDAEASVCVY